MAARRWILLAALALVVGGCASLPKTSAYFAEVTKRMDVIAVMPTAFTLGEQGAFTGQAVTEISHDIEIELNAATGALVNESRFKRAAFDFSDSTLAQDAELRTAIFEQHQAMEGVFKDLAKSKGKVIDIAYRGNVDMIADRAGAEYLLFVSGSGYFATAGAKAKGALLAALGGGVSSTSGTNLAGVLVDAKTGRVVWYNSVGLENHDPRKPSQLMQTTQKLAQQLLGKSRIKPDTSRDRLLIEKLKAMKKA